jgi:hypothetical protein
MNMVGILLGYLAVFVLGGAFLVALGLWLAGQGKIAKFLFAGGLLLATLIMAVAALSFLDLDFHHEAQREAILIVVATLVLLLAGSGQFIAAFRSSGRYAAALACALSALASGVATSAGGGDAMPFHLPAGAVISSLLAIASVVIAVLPGSEARPTDPEDKIHESAGGPR